jgi:DNA-binding response OmpR family regulator
MAKLLIADDEIHIRLLLESILEELEDEGVEILIADNGESALEMIRRERPGIVFLDVMMPKMNGFDVCNIVKQEEPVEGIYIVLLTAKGQEFDKKRGVEVGADKYMTKPFNPDEILAIAKEVLGIKL